MQHTVVIKYQNMHLLTPFWCIVHEKKIIKHSKDWMYSNAKVLNFKKEAEHKILFIILNRGHYNVISTQPTS